MIISKYLEWEKKNNVEGLYQLLIITFIFGILILAGAAAAGAGVVGVAAGAGVAVATAGVAVAAAVAGAIAGAGVAGAVFVIVCLNIPVGLNWLLFGIAVLIVTELLFYLDKRKPDKNQGKFWHTLKLKAEALIESIYLTLNGVGLTNAASKLDCSSYIPIIVHWVGIIGLSVLCLAAIAGIIAAWIWINSQRYNGKEEIRNGKHKTKKKV